MLSFRPVAALLALALLPWLQPPPTMSARCVRNCRR